jgi:thiamine-monophosphate kinase
MKSADRERAEQGGELALLGRIRARVGTGSRSGVRLGIGDDCALLGVRAGEELAVTTDLSIAGRHFRLDWHPPEAIGHRTLARGLSDLAAMGARPVAAFLSLGLPRELTVTHGRGRAWVERFYDGLLGLAEKFETPLAGGDLAESPVAVADIVLVGAVTRGQALLRSGARAGDGIYVTGRLGGAAAGLEKLSELAGGARTVKFKIPKRLAGDLAEHLYPQPRVAQGLWLRRKGLATAAMDISDGLSTDLAHLCAESKVGAEIDAKALPIGYGATLEQALHGGEDYELLFTATEAVKMPGTIAGVAVTKIGRVMTLRRGRAPVSLVTPDGARTMTPHGWEHFA